MIKKIGLFLIFLCVLNTKVFAFQSPTVIPNTSGPTFRTNLNNAFATVVSSFAGPLAPPSPVANQLWLNTTTDPGVLMLRNESNTAWLTFGVTGVAGVTGVSPILSTGGANPIISLANVTAEQGSGPKVQLAAGSTTANDCAKFDSAGNVIDAGAVCGTGSGTVTGVTGTFPIVSSGGTTPALSLSGVTAEQGNGAKVQLSTGSTTANDLTKFDSNGNTVDAGAAPYDIHIPIGTPTTSQIFYDVFTRNMTFPANFATPNSYILCNTTNPSETDTYTIKVNGSSIGTVAITTSCTATWTTTGGTSQSASAGQKFEIDAPATVSGSGIVIGLTGTRSI